MSITKKPLPDDIIPHPERANIKRGSDRAKKIITTTLITLIIALAATYLAEYTGLATTTTTVNVSDTTPNTCSLNLTPGLNIISLNCISNNQPRAEVLNNTDEQAIEAIYEYRNKQTDQWRVYNPNLPGYVVQDLDSLSRLKGYLVYIKPSMNTIIFYEGFIAASSTTPLLEDNNLVGYPSITKGGLPQALTSINDAYERIRTYNGTSWVEFNTTHNNTGGLGNLTPGMGYWVTMGSDDTWEVSYNTT